MKVDSIRKGIVLDHIQAGTGMLIYNFLKLGELSCPVAYIKNAYSKKMGKKDIIKIDGEVVINLDVLGYLAPDVTINVIDNGEIVEKKQLQLPETIKGIIKCKNPRCITSVEQGIEHEFRLVDREKRVYRCIYCESKATTNE